MFQARWVDYFFVMVVALSYRLASRVNGRSRWHAVDDVITTATTTTTTGVASRV
jgi:hypothetical protein